MKKAGEFEKTQHMSHHLKPKSSQEKLPSSEQQIQLALVNLENTIRNEK